MEEVKKMMFINHELENENGNDDEEDEKRDFLKSCNLIPSKLFLSLPSFFPLSLSLSLFIPFFVSLYRHIVG